METRAMAIVLYHMGLSLRDCEENGFLARACES